MAHYTTDITWERGDQDFLAGRYSRRHQLQFDGGTAMPGSSSPHVVPLPWSDAAAIDPEEMFVASIASCHMLWFLSIAAKQRYCVDSYRDHAVGEMGRNVAGKLVVTRVTLHPSVTLSGARLPDAVALNALHHAAHEECFIANSVKTEIVCEPVLALA
ncbi:MAG: OsmC family protein [Burkholderiaceae bacterium]